MSNVSECFLGELIASAKYNLSYFGYVILAPIYFVIGTTSRGMCLVAFYKQYKKEKGYAFQIFAMLSDILEIITVSLCMTTLNNFSGFRLPGMMWFQQNYALMWYSAHIAAPSENGFMTSSLLIGLSMSADRALAVARPFVYKNLNHKRYQTITVSLSFLFGIGTSVFDAFRFQVIQNGDHFEIVVDDVYTNSSTAMALAYLRNIIRIIATLALVFCNVVIVVYYRASVRKVTVADDQERVKRKKQVERTLVILTVCQSFFMTTDITLFNIYYTLVFTIKGFTSCIGKAMAPLADTVLQIGGMMEFFALIIVSKQFRMTIANSMPWKKQENIGQAQIAALNSANNQPTLNSARNSISANAVKLIQIDAIA